MTPTLAVAIPHADWSPGRPQALARVLDALGPVAEPDRLYVYANRDTRGEWWGHIAQWAAAQPCTHFLQVQDDLALMPGYLAVVRAMVEAVPDRIIGLHSVHQAIPQFAGGGIRWITTADASRAPSTSCRSRAPTASPSCESGGTVAACAMGGASRRTR